MAHSAEEVKTKIANAFAEAPYPGDGNLVSGHDPECREIARAFAGKRWSEVGAEMVGAYSQALPLFTPEAFRYYLGAYMMAAIDASEEAAKDFVVFNLIPPRRTTGWRADFFRTRAGQFNVAERQAIGSFLELMKERRLADWRGAGAEPPESGIGGAIEYWESNER